MNRAPARLLTFGCRIGKNMGRRKKNKQFNTRASTWNWKLPGTSPWRLL
jgi:hypothetical protein